MSHVQIRCRCGHTDDELRFATRFLESEYRCPFCGIWWRVEKRGSEVLVTVREAA